MEPGLHVFQSNRLEQLLERFQRSHFGSPCPPFCRRIVLVPHSAMKSWLQLHLASAPEVGIASGMEIYTEDPGIAKLLALFSSDQEGYAPSRMELSFGIECQLRAVMASYPKMAQAQRVLWEPLIHLVHGHEATRRQDRRILKLADELAGLFDSYAKHGGSVVDSWMEASDLGWQEHLWLNTFQAYRKWTPWTQKLSHPDLTRPPPHLKVSLFGISYLSPLHFRFLRDLSKVVPVAFFHLSACEHYWTDIRSDREARRLVDPLESSTQREALEELLQDCNPLLANLGKVGRSMMLQLDESEADFDALYELPASLEQVSCYQERITDETLFSGHPEQPLSLLESLQGDLLVMRNPSKTDPIKLPGEDRSVQIHVSSTHLREVEVLYNVLLGIIDAHRSDPKPVTPADILVLVPHIADYQTAIEAVFGSSYSQLRFQIQDLPLSAQSPLTQAFQELLALATSRWDATTLFQLLCNPFFAQKHNLSEEDLERIRSWIEDLRITWGKDMNHRNEILQRDHCRHGLGLDGEIGTWEHGFRRLVRSLATGDSSEASTKLAFTDAELFGQLQRLLESLWADLQPLRTDARMTLADWAVYLESLCEGYLSVVDKVSKVDRDRLGQTFSKLKKAANSFPDEPFSYSAVLQRLQTALNTSKMAHHEASLQTIRFGEMHAFAGLSAPVIALLGLEEGAFPRLHRKKALDLLTHHPLADSVPTPVDFDRYLFLEVLLSARQHLVLSYCAVCPTDGKEQQPSIVLAELKAYLDAFYRVDGCPAGTALTQHHPFYPFDSRYFDGEGGLKSYVMPHYKAAVARQQAQRGHNSSFLPDLFSQEATSLDFPSTNEQCVLTVKDLENAAKNPLKLYLQRTAQLYLKDFEDLALENEEAFVLSHLEKYVLKQRFLQDPLDRVLDTALQQGRLPMGLFGDYTRSDLTMDKRDKDANLENLQVKTQDIFHVELAEHCQNPRQIAPALWQLPAPSVLLPNGMRVALVGRLSNLTPQGLLSSKKDKLIREWPRLLLARQLVPLIKKHCGIELEVKALFLEDGTVTSALPQEASVALAKFVQYALSCTRQPSPLVEKWVKLFCEKPVEEIQEQIVTDVHEESFFNGEAKWLFKEGASRFDVAVIESWQKRAQEIYEEPLQLLKERK